MAVRKRGHKGDGKTRCLGGCWDSFPSCFFFFYFIANGSQLTPCPHFSLLTHSVQHPQPSHALKTATLRSA